MIDVRTFLLVLAIGNIAFALALAGYARSAPRNPAMRVWMFAKLIMGIGHFLSWARPDLPYAWVPMVANVGMMFGTALELGAYLCFFGVNRWKRYLLPAALLAVLGMQAVRLNGGSPGVLVALASLLFGVFAFARAFVLLRGPGPLSLLQRMIGLSDATFCIVMGARAYTAVYGGLTIYSSGSLQTFTYIAGFLILILDGFGFLLLCKEKDDRQMEVLATIDSLTGLLNRRAFFERVETLRSLFSRISKPIALLMLDIDHFKHLNDRFGHAAGDDALRVFAVCTHEALRENDIMGRLGGEEFAVVLPATDLDGALQVAERVRMAVSAALLSYGGAPSSMTVSIGVTLIAPNEHINAALARADQALYGAKSAGRNRVEFGEPVLATPARLAKVSVTQYDREKPATAPPWQASVGNMIHERNKK